MMNDPSSGFDGSAPGPGVTNELPSEVLGLVLGNLENVHDFARAQLVSKTFHDVVRQYCWTKVRRIHMQMKDVRATHDGGEWLEVELDTAIRDQTLVLSLYEAYFVLQKLSQKASKLQSIGINFHRLFVPRRDQVLAAFLDSLIAANVKIKDVQLRNLTPPAVSPRLTPLALARLFSANASTITSLEVVNAFRASRSGVPVPQLLLALGECRALQSVDLRWADLLVDSILQGKTQLKSLTLVSFYYPTRTLGLLESGAELRSFRCDPYTLNDYITGVYRSNGVQEHPLHTVETLEMMGNYGLPMLPWNLFPNLF